MDKPSLDAILAAWRTTRELNIYAPFTADRIQQAVGENVALPAALKGQLEWSTTVASVITDGLKGNPRQVKRMLNAMSLRKQLASVARMTIRDEVLAKLMVLEYSNLPLFQELNQWQTAEEGIPTQLGALEAESLKEEKDDGSGNKELAKWRTPSVSSWLRMKPALADVDLRDYFWLARDRTGSTLTGVAMVPPAVQAALQGLLSENAGENAKGAVSAKSLSDPDRTLLLDLLSQEAVRKPEQKAPWAALHTLAAEKLVGAGRMLIDTAQKAPTGKLRAVVPQYIAELGKTDPTVRERAVTVLEELSKNGATTAGKAAKAALTTLNKKGS